jgi:methylglutaconyl-CoA hydratase
MTEGAEPVLLARPRPGVATVTLNRPAVHNALDDRTMQAILDALAAVRAAQDVRIVVLAGNGKSFCSGADAQWAKHFPLHPLEQNHTDQLYIANVLQALRAMPQVTCALVQGAVRGGGVGLVAACDVVFATKDAHFAINEVRLGFMPSTLAPYLIEVLGMREARRWCVTGEMFDGTRAMRMGLVHEVGDDLPAIQAMGERLAHEVLQCPPKVVAMTKDLLTELRFQEATPELMSDMALRAARLVMAEETRDGFAAFLEKRKPHWAG